MLRMRAIDASSHLSESIVCWMDRFHIPSSKLKYICLNVNAFHSIEDAADDLPKSILLDSLREI